MSVLLPDRKYRGFWHRILHDQTADAIVRAVSRLPHANVTTVPFHFDGPPDRGGAPNGRKLVSSRRATTALLHGDPRSFRAPAPNGITPVAAIHLRQPVVVEGEIVTMRIRPLAGATTLECVLDDGTAGLSLVFLGRRRIEGVGVGTRLRASGTAGEHRGRLAILNPGYELLGHV